MHATTPCKPDAEDFLEMWKHFNEMAHENGIVETALDRYSMEGSTWLNYFLFFNNYQVVGQTLLVYCLREILDVAATHEFSDFDLTGYCLEPEQEYHDEEAGYLRQALDDLDVLQFVSVQNKAELKRTLPKFIKAEGILKVLVLPELEEKEQIAYRRKYEAVLRESAANNGTTYIVLMPHLPDRREVRWNYQIFDKNGAGPVEQLDEQEEYTE